MGFESSELRTGEPQPRFIPAGALASGSHPCGGDSVRAGTVRERPETRPESEEQQPMQKLPAIFAGPRPESCGKEEWRSLRVLVTPAPDGAKNRRPTPCRTIARTPMSSHSRTT